MVGQGFALENDLELYFFLRLVAIMSFKASSGLSGLYLLGLVVVVPKRPGLQDERACLKTNIGPANLMSNPAT